MAIIGMHTLFYCREPDATRDVFKTLGFDAVDAGRGWLIFRAPPGEMAVHPVDQEAEEYHESYLMCDDIVKTVGELKAKGIETSPVADRGWGLVTGIRMPGGGELGLYQPKHPTAIGSRA